ncbi:THBS2S [Mytilus edulis]|uniref:THBS2S n=1 Tax=Mytilus edulis TaxID=6550 RepID=A0A8S3UKF5_MYTED|nr:THBS2S [Mytilus edulis]
MTFVGKLTAEAKEAARANNIKALSDNIKLLTGKYQKGSIPVNSKEGKTLNTHEEQMKRLVEHFKNVLNQNPPVNKADIPPSEELLAVDCERPPTGEIMKVIKMLKNNKAPGPDNIPAEELKADIETSTQMLYELFGKILEEAEVLLEWKEEHMLVDSTHLPGNNTANALYHSNSVTDYTTLIWQDPSLAGWECRTSYRWFIEHKPSLGLLRVKVEQQESLIVDSGYIYNTAINGGRLGVFAYNQTGAIWSDLLYSCTERENKALYLNGSSYGTLGNLSSLGIEKSFTVEGWINLPIGYSSAKLPFVCSNSSDFCVYIENGNLHTQIGSRIVSGSTILPANNWTHIASVYNAQGKSCQCI